MRIRPRLPTLRSLLLACSLALLMGCVPQSEVRSSVPAARIAEPVPAIPSPGTVEPDIAMQLSALAPDADPEVLRLAVEARQCALHRGDAAEADRLTVIDYSRPSTEPRLWVFDLLQTSLLYTEVVAHGRNTGANFARHFSNDEGSFQSSLGLFRTAETYVGENGYSMRMDGLEPGINDRARERAIVMHGAWYVDRAAAARQGRLGRSLGCPALRQQVARGLIDTIKQGQLLFAYYPDKAWLRASRYLGCGQRGDTQRS